MTSYVVLPVEINGWVRTPPPEKEKSLPNNAEGVMSIEPRQRSLSAVDLSRRQNSTKIAQRSPSSSDTIPIDCAREEELLRTKHRPMSSASSDCVHSDDGSQPPSEFPSRQCRISVTKSTTDIPTTTSMYSNVTSRTCSYLQRRRCSSTASVASDALHQMMDQLSLRGITLPHKDCKILELMVSRHESQLEERDSRGLAHAWWREQRQSDVQRRSAEVTRHREHQLKKRQDERTLREFRKDHAQSRELAESQLKEEMRLEKMYKWAVKWERQEKYKKDAIQRMKLKEMNLKQAQEEVKRKRLELEEKDKLILLIENDRRLARSAQIRQCRDFETLTRVRREKAESRRRHQHQIKMIEEQLKEQLEALRAEIQSREEKAAKNAQIQQNLRDDKLKREAVSRQFRANLAKEKVDRLEGEERRRCEELFEIQLRNQFMATERAQTAIRERRQTVHREAFQKTIRHERIMNSVINQDRRRAIVASEAIRQKQEKLEKLTMRQEGKLQKSRDVAQASADLRHRLKQLLEQEVLGNRIDLSQFK